MARDREPRKEPRRAANVANRAGRLFFRLAKQKKVTRCRLFAKRAPGVGRRKRYTIPYMTKLGPLPSQGRQFEGLGAKGGRVQPPPNVDSGLRRNDKLTSVDSPQTPATKTPQTKSHSPRRKSSSPISVTPPRLRPSAHSPQTDTSCR